MDDLAATGPLMYATAVADGVVEKEMAVASALADWHAGHVPFPSATADSTPAGSASAVAAASEAAGHGDEEAKAIQKQNRREYQRVWAAQKRQKEKLEKLAKAAEQPPEQPPPAPEQPPAVPEADKDDESDGSTPDALECNVEECDEDVTFNEIYLRGWPSFMRAPSRCIFLPSDTFQPSTLKAVAALEKPDGVRSLPNGVEAFAFNNYPSKLRPFLDPSKQKCRFQRKHTLTYRPWSVAAKGWALEQLGEQLMAGLLVSEVAALVEGMSLVGLQGHQLWQSSSSAQFPYHQDTEEDTCERRHAWWYQKDGPCHAVDTKALEGEWGDELVQHQVTQLSVVVPVQMNQNRRSSMRVAGAQVSTQSRVMVPLCSRRYGMSIAHPGLCLQRRRSPALR